MDALKLLTTIELSHAGDCALLGVDHEGCVYVEELYGEHDWLAQHKISLSEGLLESVDEQYGTVPPPAPLPLPELCGSPSTMKVFDHLNFSGARWRGRIVDERIQDLLRDLSIAEKIALVDYLDWDIDPLRLLGIAESIVLSCCPYGDGEFLLCRRIRVAFRLPAAGRDDHGLDCDYDSIAVHLLHRLPGDALELPDLRECLTCFDLCRPLDCMRVDGKLYLADGGEGEIKSALHVFEIETSGDSTKNEINAVEALNSD
ncbi:MAG: hypothetical protein OXG60_14110 [Chloroflexi bacterium]|nr:hypothetical protein [Chloroflexota bacterium]